MDRRNWIWAALLGAPLLVGGLVVAATAARQAPAFVCPITGETLPCEKCCPLNDKEKGEGDGEGYICPATGEELPCPDCCPLNKGK